MSDSTIIIICFLIAIAASFYGGRNFERNYHRWKVQRDVEAIRRRYEKGG